MKANLMGYQKVYMKEGWMEEKKVTLMVLKKAKMKEDSMLSKRGKKMDYHHLKGYEHLNFWGEEQVRSK
jgi:hypothetical protein